MDVFDGPQRVAVAVDPHLSTDVEEVDEVVVEVQAGLNSEQGIVSPKWKSSSNRSGAAAAAGPAANASMTAATPTATTQRDMSDLLEARARVQSRSYGPPA